ncbi:hypothetical protein [Peribacillus loiseleuriae]|uniref:hypothetical protein n=1 Tax=Peribacillus loiseleuriae TaxID=1679170 RepID=UPI003D052BBD
MNKKWTIENIRDYVTENSECKLLSNEYLGYSLESNLHVHVEMILKKNSRNLKVAIRENVQVV